MAGLIHRTAVGEFVEDYLTTFARMLDPNLPGARLSGDDAARRPAGQVVAVATIVFFGIAGLSAAIIRYIA